MIYRYWNIPLANQTPILKYFISLFKPKRSLVWYWVLTTFAQYMDINLVKVLFLSLNFAWSSVFILKLWKVHFSSLNFEKVHFYIWISSLNFKKVCLKMTKFIYKNKLFKVQRQKPNFIQSLRTKTIFFPKNFSR